jgi:small GTP-binding protein
VIRKKVCLLGASAVGKTSLVTRFVQGTFSDIYRTTIGVKIDRQLLRVGGRQLDLILWDLEGEDAFAQVALSYLRGASGYLLVADGTRAPTLDTALQLHERARAELGDVPHVMLLNKLDLFEQWEVSDKDVARLLAQGFRVERSSAKSGAGIAEAFAHLGAALLASTPDVERSQSP